MNEVAMADALSLARRHPVFVATADAAGTPHLGCAGTLDEAAGRKLEVAEWFCPGTLANVADNPRVSLTIWDEEADRGYQIIGEVEGIETLGVLDGYAADAETEVPVPQVRRCLVVRAERILDFSRAPHTDQEK